MHSLEARTLLATVPTGFGESLLAEGLNSPTSMAFAPDGRLFVNEKNGAVRIIKNGSLLSTPFATFTTDTFGERGLNGITFDPDFENNHYVYIYYTASTPIVHNRVSRVVADGDVMTPGSEEVLLDLPTMGSQVTIHNGGALQFAPDGTLFVAVGEQGSNGDVADLDHPFGKILRINPDGSIPGDNPFFDETTGINRAIWATGLRNPFTTAFQPTTGRFYINDVGQDAWEEINEGVPGANYGWIQTEGPFDPLAYPALTNPAYAYPHTVGFAVTGGTFYNPSLPQFPSSFVGQYFFADYAVGFIKTLDPVTKQVNDFATGAALPVDLDVGPDGALYYLSRYSNAVYKISATQAPQIVAHPQSQLIHTGDGVTFTAAASGLTPLSYQWQRNGVDIVGATSSSYSIENTELSDDGDLYRCVISNSLGAVTTNAATLDVTDDTPPAPAISVGTTYFGGQTINFGGGAFDLEDGQIPASNMTWEIVFHHGSHVHPAMAPLSGVSSGQFTVPTFDHGATNVWYRIHLTVTDSAGFTRSTYRDIQPQLRTITLNSNVPGMVMHLDGHPHVAPAQITALRGCIRTLEALESVVVDGTRYNFVGWSDGGGLSHTITFPNVATTYTATFVPSTDNYLSDMDPSAIVGTPQNDRDAAGGNLEINGVPYLKGLGFISGYQLDYALNGVYASFTAKIGLDDLVGDNGSVTYEVWGDGVKLYDSGLMTGATPLTHVVVNVAGVQQLLLKVTDGGDDFLNDWANWVDAIVHADAALAPVRPNQLVASAPFYNRVALTWNDRVSNEQGFEIQRSLDGVNFTTLDTVDACVTSYIDTNRSPQTTYHYRLRAYNGVGNSPYTAAVLATTGAATLPMSWAETDIGAILPSDAGNASFDGSIYTVRAGGQGIDHEADSFHFVYRTLVGDGQITARLTGVSDVTAGWAGVMMRESLSASSPSFFLHAGHNVPLGSMRRLTPGGVTHREIHSFVPLPFWLRLTRVGEVITGYVSPDGTSWTPFSTMTMEDSAPLYVGLAMSSQMPEVLSFATYDNVSVTNLVPTLATTAAALVNSTKTGAILSALGADDGAGEAGLTYTWTAIEKPEGAPDPLFDINGTNAAKNALVSFAANGAYTLRVTISDGEHSIVSDVPVLITPQLTTIAVTPATLTLAPDATQQFSAAPLDQFGGDFESAETIVWSAIGGGTIDQDGLYTAPGGDADVTVRATLGALHGDAAVSVDGQGPEAVFDDQSPPDAGAASYTFTVTYFDIRGIDVATLGSDDLLIIGPDDQQYAAVFLSASPETNESMVVATYRFNVPDGCFDSYDNGTWQVHLVGGTVSDAMGSFADGVQLGYFEVDAPFAVLDESSALIVNGTEEDDFFDLNTDPSGGISVILNDAEIVFPAELVGQIILRGRAGSDTININDSLTQTVTFLGESDDDTLNVNQGIFAFESDMPGLTVNVWQNGMVQFNDNVNLSALNLYDGAAFIAHEQLCVTVDSLTMSQQAVFDVSAGCLIVHGGELGGWDGGYTGITGLVAAGRNGGLWDLPGIISSAAAATAGETGVSVARAGDLLGIDAGETTLWRGRTVSADSILVLYTWNGDVDLNGELTGDDYFFIDSNILNSGSVFGYSVGDFDLNGEINGDDYFLIDSIVVLAQASGRIY